MLVSITIEAGCNKTLSSEDYGIYRQRLLQRRSRSGWAWNDEVRVPGTVEVRAPSRLEYVPIPRVKPRIDNRLIPWYSLHCRIGSDELGSRSGLHERLRPRFMNQGSRTERYERSQEVVENKGQCFPNNDRSQEVYENKWLIS
jgi:hypothetical protein